MITVAAKYCRIILEDYRYVIGGSYPMRQLRAVRDLDILMPADEFDRARRSRIGELDVSPAGTAKLRFYVCGVVVELYDEGFPAGFMFKDLVDEGFDCDEWGNPCWTLDQVVRCKRNAGRPKDLEDIRLVEEANATAVRAGV